MLTKKLGGPTSVNTTKQTSGSSLNLSMTKGANSITQPAIKTTILSAKQVKPTPASN